jgi:hypothetical protein
LASAHRQGLRRRPRGYRCCLYASRHTTAGFLPQSLAVRLTARPDAIRPYLDLFRTVFPEARATSTNSSCATDGAGEADRADQRRLAPRVHRRRPAARRVVDARRPGPVYLVDLDLSTKASAAA